MPDITIIVPVYNVEKFIGQCIKSLIEQSYQNIEIILVNDGSTDGSAEICKHYAELDNRIVYIYQTNQGVSIARNKGIEISTGKWIVFVDGDDWVEPLMIEYLYDNVTFNGADICIASFYTDRLNHSEKDSFFRIGDHDFTDLEKKSLLKDCINVSTFGNKHGSTNVGVPWAKIYRREMLDLNNVRFKPRLKRMQDTIFNLYAFQNAGKIVFRDYPVYHYRMFEESACNKYSPHFQNTATEVLNEIEIFAERYDMKKEFPDDYYAKAIKLYIQCIRLQFVPDECMLSFRNKSKQMRKLVKQYPYILAIKEAPFNLLSNNQKIACILMRFNAYEILYFLCRISYYRNKKSMFK